MLRLVSAGAAILSLAACGAGSTSDKTVDAATPFDSKDLSELVAGIWVSPNGCDYWIVDDGAEGFLSQRFDRQGDPICPDDAEPNMATGPFKEGSDFPDYL